MWHFWIHDSFSIKMQDDKCSSLSLKIYQTIINLNLNIETTFKATDKQVWDYSQISKMFAI